jgi:DNA-directed RNA polymerase subunit RPC12/RpoP
VTTGDNYNIDCPYCGKTNHYVTQGRGHKITPDEIAVFSRECWHCKEKIIYQVRMVMSVEAYQQGEANSLVEVLK